jgi:hypothetical protein
MRSVKMNLDYEFRKTFMYAPKHMILVNNIIPFLNQSFIIVGVGALVGLLDVCTMRLVAPSLPPQYHFNLEMELDVIK